MPHPFLGWCVWNKNRNTMVFDDDNMGFVWDDRQCAQDACREGHDDEVRRVQVTLVEE